MNKKTIVSIITLSFCSSLGLAQIATAEEGIMPIYETEGVPTSDDTPVEGVIDIDAIDDSTDEPTTVIDTDTNVTIDSNLESDSELENDIDHNGTSGEAEVVCASADEPGCEDEATDPEMWPLYLSLGALGATILLVLIINLIGHRKK